jgi:MATE family multidrug resistance protein
MQQEPLPSSSSRCKEFRLMVGLAAPTALVNALRTAQLLTDQAIIGHLRLHGHSTPLYLDAAALALLWMNLTLQMVNRSTSGTIQMLVSQALGAGNHRLADVWLYTGLVMCIIGALLISGLWLLTSPIVALFAHNQTIGSPEAGSGPDDPDALLLSAPLDPSPLIFGRPLGPGSHDPVELAGYYSRLSVGYVLPTLWMEALSNWLVARRIIKPQLFVYGAAFALNIGLNVLLVYGIGDFQGLGFTGSPIATTVTRVFQLLALVAALPICGIRLPRCHLSAALKPKRMRIFLSQAVPRCVSACLEEVSLQISGALAGRLGVVPTATHNSMLMAFFWLTAPLYGVGTATQQRMGFHLGAGRPHAARLISWLCLYVQMSLGLVVAALLVGLREEIGRVFSSSEAVVHMVGAIAPLVGAAYLLVGLFYSSMATLGGQGRPLPVALAFFLGAFLISPTTSYLLAFVAGCCGEVKLYGLWIGLIGGYTVTTFVSITAVYLSDWELISKQAQARSEARQSADTPVGHGGASDGAAPAAHDSSSSRGDSNSNMAAPLLLNTALQRQLPHSDSDSRDRHEPGTTIDAAEVERWAEAD